MWLTFVVKDYSVFWGLFLFVFFRDAVSDLALHFLAKMKIMVIKDIEREDVEFVCKVRDSFLY